jgi:hypothetical protein
MKLAIEILNREIAQRKLANKHEHLRKDVCTQELKELESVVNLLAIPIVSVSLFDTLQDLIEVYEERETKASKMGNWSEAFQNEIRVGVLQHLAQLHKHKNNER